MVKKNGGIKDGDLLEKVMIKRSCLCATKDDKRKTDQISFVYLVIVLSNMYI